MEQAKTKTNIFYSMFAVLLAVVCCVLFSACGSTLDQQATYDSTVNYSEDATTADTNPAVDAIMSKISRNGVGTVTSFDVLSAFRFTMITKDTQGNVKIKANMAAKDKQLMLHYEASYSELKGYVNVYIKEGFIYTQQKSGSIPEVKTKANISGTSFEECLTSYGFMTNFPDYISQLKDTTVYTIKKSGTNFKFTYESTSLAISSKVIILQMDNDNNVKAIHIETTDSTWGSTELTFSAFTGNLNFPDLSGY